jgi:hypothetical protein
VNALTTAGDAGKKLRAIRKRQLGTKDAEPEAVITPAMALAIIMTAIAAAQDNDAGYDLFVGCQEIADTWGKTQVAPEVLNGWSDKYVAAIQHGVATHVEVITAPETAETAAAN